MTRILNELSTVFHKDNFIFNLLAALVVWISPALELIFLLYFLVVLDWMLDICNFMKSDAPKVELWKSITKPMTEKLLLFSTLAVASFAVEVHLFKNAIPLYMVVMGVPISGELISITKTVEAHTGIKVVSKIQEIFNSFFGSKSKIDDSGIN